MGDFYFIPYYDTIKIDLLNIRIKLSSIKENDNLYKSFIGQEISLY